MPRTSELSSKKQTPKVRGYKTENHARRDGSVKLRRRDDGDMPDFRQELTLSVDWEAARQGDPNAAHEMLPYIPGIGQIAKIEYANWRAKVFGHQPENYNPYGLRQKRPAPKPAAHVAGYGGRLVTKCEDEIPRHKPQGRSVAGIDELTRHLGYRRSRVG